MHPKTGETPKEQRPSAAMPGFPPRGGSGPPSTRRSPRSNEASQAAADLRPQPPGDDAQAQVNPKHGWDFSALRQATSGRGLTEPQLSEHLRGGVGGGLIQTVR